MKRILCFIDSLGSGGAQRQMTELAKLLHQAGYPIKVVYWVYYKNDHFLVDELTECHVETEYASQMRPSRTRLFEMQKVIRKFNPDVIISYYSGISKLLCVDHFFHRKTYKLIVSERTITRTVSTSSKIKHQLYRFADVIVPNSTTESKFIIAHFPFLKDKVKTINNFVDEDKFYPMEKCVSDYEKTNAIFVGRFNEAKNIPNLLKAIGVVKNKGYHFHIDFYGRDIAENCSALVSELGVEDIVSLCDQSRVIEQKYREHNLFIIASLWEGFPNVLCEAMCCGLPVIGSRVSDIPYIMEDGKNGYVFDPTNIDDMADKIICYLQLDAQEKAQMAKHSEALSQDKFKKSGFLSKYIELIK